jgi:hypothetical protein
MGDQSKSTLTSSAQMVTIEEKVQRALYNPVRLFRGSEYTVTKQVPAPAPEPENLSNLNNSSSSNPTPPPKTDEKKEAGETKPPVDQKIADQKQPEEKAEIEPSVLQRTLGLGAFMTSRLVNAVGYKYVLVEGKLTLVKNETKTTETTNK